MKIVLIHNRFGRETVGGAEIVVTQLREELLSQGHDALVVSTERFHGLQSLTIHHHDSDDNGIYRFYPLNIFSFLSLGHHGVMLRMMWHKIDCFNIHAVWAFRNFFKEAKPGLVWSHNLVGIARPLRFAIPSNTRWIHTLHDVQLLYPSGLLLYGHEHDWVNQGFVARWYQAWMRWLIGSPSQVISPSKWLLGLHQRAGFFKQSEKIIRPNVTRETTSTFRGQQGRDDDTKHILFVGQLERHKGILFLVKALATQRALLTTPWKLDIVGEGPLRQKIEEMCADDQRFVVHGRLNGNDYQDMLHQADIVIVPSLCYENYPTIIVEALARGIPVVASRIGGIPEMIREGIDGWLFEPGNIDACIQTTAIALDAVRMPESPELAVVKTDQSFVDQLTQR